MKLLSMHGTTLKQHVHCLLWLLMDNVVRNLRHVCELCLQKMAFPGIFVTLYP